MASEYVIKASHVLIGLLATAVLILAGMFIFFGLTYAEAEERRVAALPPPRLQGDELAAAVVGKSAVGIDPTTGDRHVVFFGADGSCPLVTPSGQRVDGIWAPSISGDGGEKGVVRMSWNTTAPGGVRRDLAFRAKHDASTGHAVLLEDGPRGMVMHCVPGVMPELSSKSAATASAVPSAAPSLANTAGSKRKGLTFIHADTEHA